MPCLRTAQGLVTNDVAPLKEPGRSRLLAMPACHEPRIQALACTPTSPLYQLQGAKLELTLLSTAQACTLSCASSHANVWLQPAEKACKYVFWSYLLKRAHINPYICASILLLFLWCYVLSNAECPTDPPDRSKESRSSPPVPFDAVYLWFYVYSTQDVALCMQHCSHPKGNSCMTSLPTVLQQLVSPWLHFIFFFFFFFFSFLHLVRSRLAWQNS